MIFHPLFGSVRNRYQCCHSLLKCQDGDMRASRKVDRYDVRGALTKKSCEVIFLLEGSFRENLFSYRPCRPMVVYLPSLNHCPRLRSALIPLGDGWNLRSIMSDLPPSFVASIARALIVAQVPCVLWGECLLNTHGVPSVISVRSSLCMEVSDQI